MDSPIVKQQLQQRNTRVIDTPGGSTVLGAGKSIPGNVVRMTDLMAEIQSEKHYGIAESWLTENTGIIESRAVQDRILPSDLAIEAAQGAITQSGIQPSDIGLVIFCAIDRDFSEPSTAHVVQQAVGASGPCFDVSSACHGFIHGMHIADALIQLEQVRYALVVSGETPSRVTRLIIEFLKKARGKDQFLKMIGGITTGDSGGAVVLGPGNGIKRMLMSSEGKHFNLCTYQVKGHQIEGQLIMNKLTFQGLRMHRELWSLRNPVQSRSTDWVISHQTGRGFHQRLQKMTGIDMKRIPETYPRLGNLVSSTIPVNLALLKERTHISGKQNVLIMGSGSGLSVSHTYMEY